MSMPIEVHDKVLTFDTGVIRIIGLTHRDAADFLL